MTSGAAPSVEVIVAPALVRLFPGIPARQTVQAGSVSALLAELDSTWPGLRDRVCDSTPAIRPNMQVFIDGQRAGLDAPLHQGAVVSILTAISGG